MAHVALYRQFRPVTFDEIVEQKHAVAALRQSVISGQIGHAYLFCGTRGTGKTSIAKIFSRAINCLSPSNGNPCNECEICRGILDNTLMDVIEMDAASNNSVDNIRRVCDEVMFLPSRTKYKVYIIDEVHMLSGGAFNALLKTLEEPPAHAVFILATTEPHRIPATIISRCQRYDFRRIATESMVDRLQEIADAQQTAIDHDALVTISNLSDGALRDAISLFDQVSTGISRQITRDDVLRITGVVDDSFLYAMSDALLSGDASSIVRLTEQLVMDGRDMIRFTLDLAHYFRDLMVIRVTPDPLNLVQATSDSMVQMQEIAGRTSAETLVYAVTRLSGLVSELKWSPDMRTSFEIALLSFQAGDKGSGFPDSTSVPAKSVSKSSAPATPPPAPPVTAPAASPVTAPVTAPAAPPVTVAIPATPPAAPPVPAPITDSIPAPVTAPSAAPVPAPLAVPMPVQTAAVPTFSSIPEAPGMAETAFSGMMKSLPPQNKAQPSPGAKRSYMAPPSIEDMFNTPSIPQTPGLSPLEASLLPPPEEEEVNMEPLPFESLLSAAIPDQFQSEAPVSTVIESPDYNPAGTQAKTPPDSVPPVSVPPEDAFLLPPPPMEPVPRAVTPSGKKLPLSELWAVLLHQWEDTLFSDALQLKHASIMENEHTFYIIFPDHMRAYAKNLTGRADYKKISKDIMTVVPGISSVEIQTESNNEASLDAKSNKQPEADTAPAQPEWVAQMLAFSEATGIPVETMDNL